VLQDVSTVRKNVREATRPHWVNSPAQPVVMPPMNYQPPKFTYQPPQVQIPKVQPTIPQPPRVPGVYIDRRGIVRPR
jgi:hypothetical protein